jgi:hypothetical protein
MRPVVALGSRLSHTTDGARKATFESSLVLGAATGMLWAPCAGPILGRTEALLAQPIGKRRADFCMHLIWIAIQRRNQRKHLYLNVVRVTHVTTDHVSTWLEIAGFDWSDSRRTLGRFLKFLFTDRGRKAIPVGIGLRSGTRRR